MLNPSRVCSQAEANQEVVLDRSSQTILSWKEDSVSTARVIKQDLQIETEYIFWRKSQPLVLSI